LARLQLQTAHPNPEPKPKPTTDSNPKPPGTQPHSTDGVAPRQLALSCQLGPGTVLIGIYN